MLDRFLLFVGGLCFIVAALIASGVIDAGNASVWFYLGLAADSWGIALYAYPRLGDRGRA